MCTVSALHATLIIYGMNESAGVNSLVYKEIQKE